MTKQRLDIAALIVLSLAFCVPARAEPALSHFAREFVERVGHHGLMEIIKCWQVSSRCSSDVPRRDVDAFRSLSQKDRDAIRKAFGTGSADPAPNFDPKRSLTGPAH